MTEDVDKVARAIWDASPPVLRDTDSAAMMLWPMAWEALDEPTRAEFMALARSALSLEGLKRGVPVSKGEEAKPQAISDAVHEPIPSGVGDLIGEIERGISAAWNLIPADNPRAAEFRMLLGGVRSDARRLVTALRSQGADAAPPVEPQAFGSCNDPALGSKRTINGDEHPDTAPTKERPQWG